MVKSSDNNGSSVPPFLLKVYEMVDDQASDAIISWTPSNASFVIWDMTQFSLQLLPNYFKHKNFSSFMRQLNIYGFRKIDTDRWEFANEGFIRGQKQLLNNIIRRKYSQALDQKKSSQEKHKSDDAFQDIKTGLWKEVESLKIDKNALTQELVTLRQHQETSDNKLLGLRERLQGMEKTQQQMLSFLVMAMQSPGILAQFLQPKEKNWRRTDAGKNMLEEVIEEEETLASDGMIVKYNPMMDDISKPLLPPASNSEESIEFDLSDGMKDLIVNVDFMKTMMDENLCSSENLSPFILPDLPDDGLLEQLLLGSPFSFPENTEDANLDSQEHIDSMEMEPTVGGTQVERFLNFNFQIEQVEKDQYLETESPPDGPQLENPQNLDF